MKRRILIAMMMACCAIALLPIPRYVGAQEDLVNFAGKDPSEEELLEALDPRSHARKTRGVSPGATGAAAATALTPRKVSFDQITFDLNSDRITPKGRGMLDKLGRVLSSEQLADVTYVIEGHTDASGSLQYNMGLSKRRAESVKRYLLEDYDVEPARLRTEGKGPTDLLDKENPKSAVNRRVVFVAEEAQ
jgi:outer membrane protein OmpA-like peptidoglycan-associated protein